MGLVVKASFLSQFSKMRRIAAYCDRQCILKPDQPLEALWRKTKNCLGMSLQLTTTKPQVLTSGGSVLTE